MEQKQFENEEYLEKKKAEIAELEEEHEELQARLQELQLITEKKKAQDLKSEIADMKKLIISNQKSAEESIAALGELMQLKYVDIEKRMDSLQTVIEQTALLTTNDVNARISNFQDYLINISTKLETLERTLMNKLEWKDNENPTILVLGGKGSNKMHLLNRDRTRWSTLSLNLPMSLCFGGAVYLDEEIYIFGGIDIEKKTYKLNRKMKWIQLADMNEERSYTSNISVVFDGCIWVFGGWNHSENYLNSVEKYIPEENKWIQMPFVPTRNLKKYNFRSMKEKRVYAAAAACQGKLFVSGGFTVESNYCKYYISMECFDPASQKWTMFLDLPSPTGKHAMISDGICLTVLGGVGVGEGKSVWKINPNEEKASWKKLPQMRESRYWFTANLLGDNIFAIGGVSSLVCRKVEVFNGETWEDGPELPEKIEGTCSIVIPVHLAAALSSHQ